MMARLDNTSQRSDHQRSFDEKDEDKPNLAPLWIAPKHEDKRSHVKREKT